MAVARITLVYLFTSFFPNLPTSGIVAPAAAQVSGAAPPVVYRITPGTTSRAEVELTIGEPRGPAKTHFEYQTAFEYPPPPPASGEAQNAERVVVVYFRDTRLVARVDVYLKTPAPARALREQFGTRVLVRSAADGASDEIYYPKLQGLLTRGEGDAALVVAAGSIAPQYLANIFIVRFDGHLAAKRYDEARIDADKAVLVDPDYAGGYVAQGRYYWARENFDEAIVRFTAGANARYGPTAKSQAHEWLAFVYWQNKKTPDLARKQFEKAIAVAPDRSAPYVQFGRFLRDQKQDDEAIAPLTRAVILSPESVDARALLGSILVAKRDYAAALSHYERLHLWAMSPAAVSEPVERRAFAHFLYGVCLEQTKRIDAAIPAYEQAVKVNPAYASAWTSLGIIHHDRGDLPKALTYYERGLAASAKDPFLNQQYAIALIDAGRAPEAFRRLDVSLESNPKDTLSMVYYARGYAAMKKKREAVAWLRKAVAAGYSNRSQITGDKYFAGMRNDGEFKKLLEEMR